jgi:hypothetical protein
MEDLEWIVPFKGRNLSGVYNQNFLCRQGRVYVMDNHRAALWCWNQEINLCGPHSIIHIDRHTDALGSQLDVWLKNLPDLSDKISSYLDATYDIGCMSVPVIRWDNYLSIYVNQFRQSLGQLLLCTHGEGDIPKHEASRDIALWDLLENFDSALDCSSGPWIVNVDLDYFFCPTDQCTEDGEDCVYTQMVSDAYIERVFELIAKGLKDERIGVVTVCLTPTNFTGGWGATEAMANLALRKVGLEFRLPT